MDNTCPSPGNHGKPYGFGMYEIDGVIVPMCKRCFWDRPEQQEKLRNLFSKRNHERTTVV